MSGICARFHFDDRPVEPGDLDPMLAALRAWGQGGESAWIPSSGRAGLACRLDRVTLEDAFEVQPAVSAGGHLALVADARIDNRQELSGRLGIPPAEARRLPDSAFILAAYRAWGEDCAHQLVGDFAFALWDESRQSLYCVRDPIGMRVLFYHRTDRFLAIASSIPALLAVPGIEARLNERKVAELLVLLEDAESTCFSGILRVPAGHAMTVSAGGIRLRRTWDPDIRQRLMLKADEDYLEAFDDVFGRAVRDRLRSTKPVAILLSAGLDSTAVAAVAADGLRQRGERLMAYHSAPAGHSDVTRPGWIADESADVCALTAMHDNIDLRIVRRPARTLLDDAVRSFDVVGAPIRNSVNLSWIVELYEQAAQRGAGVMLNGGNGNLTISYTGMRSIRDMARRGRLLAALREAHAMARVRGHRPRDVVKDQIVLPLIPASVLRLASRLRGHAVPPIWERTLSAIRPDFARAMRLEETELARAEDEDTLERMGAAEYRLHVLRSGGDGLDTYHSMREWWPLETRTPTTDVRVIEFCLALPGTQYLRHGRDRLLVRRGMRGRIPESILQRKTRGAQAADWPIWLDRMRPDFVAELTRMEKSETARRCLDTERLRNLIENWPTRFGPQHAGDYDLLLVRGIMMGRFIRWFEEKWS